MDFDDTSARIISHLNVNRKNSFTPSFSNEERKKSGIDEWKVDEYWEPDEGPHQVWVNINIHRLDQIDTVNQTFGTEFTVIQCWIWSKMDEELNSDFLTANLNSLTCHEDQQLKVSWQPKSLKFPNAMNSQLFVEEEGLNLKKYNDLVLIEKKTRVSGLFSEKFELESFPFDCQDFHIDIDWDDSEKTCKISPNPLNHDFVTLNIDSMVQKLFKIHEPIVETFLKPIKVVSEGMRVIHDHQPSIAISLKGERVWISYFWQIFLLLSLMSTFSLFAFTLEIQDSGNRLNFTMTVFLTKVAFQFSISSLLPKLSYVTLLDIYVIVSMVFGCSVMLQIAIMSWVITNDAFEITPFMNNTLFGVNAFILTAGNLCLCIYISRCVLPKEKLKLIFSEWSHTKYHVRQKPLQMNRHQEEQYIKKQILMVSKNLTKYQEPKRKFFVVNSWISLKLKGHGNYAYVGEGLGRGIIEKFYENNFELLNVPNLHLNYFIREKLCGLWIMRLAKVEFLSAKIVINFKKLALKFIKVTGNSGVTAGKPFMLVNGIPYHKNSLPIQGKTHLHTAVGSGPSKMQWTSAEITMPRFDKILIKNSIHHSVDHQIINIYRYEDDMSVPYSVEDDLSEDEEI